jgi:succinate dehydrogenase/fumarate reductase flavoprotein subunit|tara:strand:- start:1199 stop:1408 length:210 start_codon:yes stop_codon:yes gene_type:complete
MKQKKLSVLVQEVQGHIYDIMHLNTDNRREIDYLHTRLKNLNEEHVNIMRTADEAASALNDIKEYIKNG